ncbi:hypothetical protein M406DRAFT_36782 [Cryphonectria parasitica EP155]|uniref:A-kinase anchor protein 7-like phosphoesterase domain-containing protein n=1 Tax=Cryphonectria parasitica (strain ATCC 38755 / EP155) TaxID=660469 RepID=A0A9P4Y471_CRYP1|nr:uncharacterized protein M406DRAFT_36782 [Cryphonectria parasitica EP155]KAF3765855.1 hypothetical protein M406DRAFT_36782 [Cryphonectria parasitica EP155]
MTSSQKTNAHAPLTHFLCIPLSVPTSRPQLSASLASFQDDVTRPKDLGGFDLPPDAVRPVGTLHLTLGMMSFPRGGGGEEGLARAVEMLRALKPREVLAGLLEGKRNNKSNSNSHPQVLITLKGLNSMQKPERTTVLYAPPSDPEDILQAFSEHIRATFRDAGLLAPDERPLLLHATIVNTVYVKGSNRGNKSGQRGRKDNQRHVVRDAQAMLDRYEEHVWVEDVPLETIAICRMGAKPLKEDGVVVDVAYEVEAEIAF